MIVEASNPAHSLADSPAFREALAALDTVVVIDVAMSETARHADYVLPSASQFEKAEATFFNFEFPDNYFHLRPRLLDPPQGPLPEAEIHARLCEALGAFDDDFCAPLRDAAADGLPAFGMAFMQHVLSDPTKRGLAAVLLYRTLGPSLPEPVREGAVLLGLALRFAMGHPDALSRAGFGGPPPMAAMALFQAILDTPSGVVFAKGDWSELKPGTPSGRFELALDDMLDAVASLGMPPEADADWPFVLSAGERRAFTANTIIRDPAWRDTDPEGALRISPGDAAALGVSTGDRVALSTRRGTAEVSVEVSDAMRPGHVSLPNGLGLDVTNADGTVRTGVAANELTAAEDRDRYAGTPWHKWVPARLEAIPA
jgi:anaerobic selenocysteine-containing dehydrogenase